MARPLLHFAHANGFPSACYERFLTPLADVAEVKSIALLAHDPAFPVTTGWGHIADQVADSIRRQCDRPVIGIGHSLGAVTTLIAAHRYPELFSGLILMDPPVMNGMTSLFMGLVRLTGQMDRFTPAGKSKHRRSVWPDRETARANLQGKALFKHFDAGSFDAYIAHGLEDCAEGVQLVFRASVEVEIFRTGPWNAWALRHPLAIPGTVITGEHSEFRKMGTHDRLARQQHFPHLFTPGGHMFPLEYPEQTARLVSGLIESYPHVAG